MFGVILNVAVFGSLISLFSFAVTLKQNFKLSRKKKYGPSRPLTDRRDVGPAKRSANYSIGEGFIDLASFKKLTNLKIHK